ncbi:AraC family ligand binding domain-containing protein [Levilactobacillus parabrevis]|uniref:AraC family ligand binding domain-containing protein n=1 Tax=Levilactobacillus parabrevis TaxID=357278 RepID=UPI0021A92585|nr:AraC family ligand binding domain-containing protein [Levilactobacillus parabrevis]
MRRLQDFDNEYLFVLPKDVLQDYTFSPIIANLYVTDLGFFPNAQYHYVNRERGSAGWVIIFCTGGSGTVIVDDTTYHLHQYSLIIMPPGIKHTYYASKDDPWDIYWFLNCQIKCNTHNPFLSIGLA